MTVCEREWKGESAVGTSEFMRNVVNVRSLAVNNGLEAVLTRSCCNKQKKLLYEQHFRLTVTNNKHAFSKS